MSQKEIGISAGGTPDDILRDTLKAVDTALANELLERIIAAPPVFFENLIVGLLIGMGLRRLPRGGWESDR